MLKEARVTGEIVVFPMLKHENPAFFEQAFALWLVPWHDKARQGFEIVKGVWWVGEDKVELPFACLYEAENVASD